MQSDVLHRFYKYYITFLLLSEGWPNIKISMGVSECFKWFLKAQARVASFSAYVLLVYFAERQTEHKRRSIFQAHESSLYVL